MAKEQVDFTNDFEEYIRQGEPDKKEKGKNWQTAIGLQQVDGLKPSAYLIENAIQNIEGKITIDEVQYRIDSYYKTKTVRTDDDDRTKEADLVSTRIVKILSNETFSFSPLEYIAIHRELFTGIYKFAGKIRDYNISKAEWVLNGKSVLYANAPQIRATLDYDFNQEKQYDYKSTDFEQSIRRLVKFISSVWQIHAFGEGNTRTTAVFTIKYLRSWGYKIDNKPFAKHSWYFRNALVRANYNDWTNNIHATPEYLMLFFGNLLLGENNILKNRTLHINFVPTENAGVKQENVLVNVPVNVPVKKDITLTEKLVLDLLKIYPGITYEQIAEKISKNRKTVQRTIVSLKEKGIISRIGSDKTGTWKILIMEENK